MESNTTGATSFVTVNRQNNSASTNRATTEDGENLFLISKCRRESPMENQQNPETSDETDTEEAIPYVELRGFFSTTQQSQLTFYEIIQRVLAVYWRAGKLGAAYYSVQASELNVLEEIVDRAPRFQMLANLYRQADPSLLLTEGKNGTYIKQLKTLVFDDNDSKPGAGHCKLNIISSKEYNFEACKRRIYTLALPYEPQNCTEEDRAIFLRTVVNFSQTQSVHALGTLLRYLDLNWSNLNMDLHSKPKYLALKKMSLADIVSIDEDTYKGLQIFSPIAHPAGFKRGMQTANKEGLSLYSIFNKCYSKVGQSRLRVLLQHPTHDMATLKRRQDVIAFFMRSQNDVIMRNICSSLRFIKNCNGILTKINSLSAKSYQWKSLYNTLYNAVLICELCENVKGSEFLEEMASCDNNKLYEMALYMNRIIDFDLSKSEGKFTVKAGVDPELDKKKQTMASLQGLMSETAKLELEKLPAFVEECNMLYMPHLGYLLAVRQWDPNLTLSQKQLPDMNFMFQNNEFINYKSKGCEELDVMIGDTYPEIVAHETKIMMRLTSLIMENIHTLDGVIQKCAELDCLIAISRVCKDYNFVRPVLTTDKIIKIKQGKHPLHMLCSDNFVPNDTVSNEEEGFVKILTGPNSSGKSVYLKQVGLIAYLGHIGSFVPAEACTLGTLTHIYTRLHATECIAAHMSAFLIDLRQMSLALQEASSNALIIIDEFGKGTSEVDGLALLAASLNTFLCQQSLCPHVFLSTHFLNIQQFIVKTPLVKFQRLEHTMEDEEPVFLFQLTCGETDDSFARVVARSAGISATVVRRADQLMDAVMNNILPPPNPRIISKLKTFTDLIKNDLISE